MIPNQLKALNISTPFVLGVFIYLLVSEGSEWKSGGGKQIVQVLRVTDCHSEGPRQARQTSQQESPDIHQGQMQVLHLGQQFPAL